MKTKEKRLLKILSTLILIICMIIFVQFIWAKYMTSVNGNAEADIAKWTLKVTDGTNKFSINLAETRDGVQEAEVQSDYIGPGTSGKFIIEVDATNTEVSLAYNINMEVNYNDKHEFPKNLIFYSDENMTNAIYHTNNAIELNGFIGEKFENKTIQHKIYWKWDFETGQTQTDKEENDIEDSFWIGRNISVPITVVGQQVNQNPNTNQYAVTFDANGGTLKGYGNSGKMTKNLITGEQYGELPVPVKDGYEFLGWNGRNLFDIKKVEVYNNGVNVIDENWISINTTSNQKWYNYWTRNLDINEGSPYIIAVEIREAINLSGDLVITSGHSYDVVSFRGQFPTKKISSNELMNNSIIINNITSNTNVQSEFGLRTYYENKNNKDNEKIVFRISVIDNQDISADNFKYEPYYICSTTEVVQNTNHTLTAMWEKLD